MRRQVGQSASSGATNGVWHLALYPSEKAMSWESNSLCGRAHLHQETQSEVPRGDRLCVFCADTPNRHQERPRV